MLLLLDSVRAAFSRELVGHVAARLGESENGIHRALGGIVPMVLCGLINKAASCEPETIFLFSERAYQLANGRVGSVMGMLAMLGGGVQSGSALRQGEDLLATLFGATVNIIAVPVSTYAGIRPESSMVLLRLVGAVLPAMLGQYAAFHQLNALSFTATLLSLKNKARALLPSGLSGLTGLLWLGGLGAKAPRPVMATIPLPMEQRIYAHNSFLRQRWGQVAALLVGLMLVFYIFVGSRPTASESSARLRAGAGIMETKSSEVNYMAF